MIIVGWKFYKYGEVFLLSLFYQNNYLVKPINNSLLIGYYLINLGYAILTIAYWEQINSILQLLNVLSTKLGTIIIAISILHYNNIMCLKYIIKSKTLNQ